MAVLVDEAVAGEDTAVALGTLVELPVGLAVGVLVGLSIVAVAPGVGVGF